MLESVKIQKRQSEIRQNLSELVGKDDLTDDETRKINDLDKEYQTNETRYRAALIAEDEERQDAKGELETRSDREYAELIDQFEVRQVVLALNEGHQLDGPTAEVVQEMRTTAHGPNRLPVPWQALALETRAGETVASGTPDPITTRPIIDRLFPQSVAARMGGSMISIGQGETEWPVVTSSVTAGWQPTETGDVAGPTQYTTLDRPLKPDHTLGIQMKITRRSLKQSGAALEQAVRRDMNGAIQQELDKAVFRGSGSNGEPTGILTGAAGFGITETALDAAPDWAEFRAAVVRFMLANAANSPNAVRLMIRPEVWSTLDNTLISGTAVSEWERLTRNIPTSNVVLSNNALAAPVSDPVSDPAESVALMTTSAGGTAPFYVGMWGGVDLIRDPYSDAASGGLRLTALATMDVTISRAAQLEILTDIQ
ncbi:MAG: phage major capsid protein [Roseitalea porphyridii]|jgi:HK97 family phage major capsid protein|uniref:phage major capsid protein n=1 Tax=Roseitalea porphyridii TaxID=1852022 RepID=UPI0032ED4DC1